MTTIETVVLLIHIAAGVLALLTGLGALATAKGSRLHVRSGRLFVGAMFVVVVTVFALTLVDATTPRLILSLVAVFTGYFVFAGYRIVSRKHRSNEPDSIDWAAVGMLVAVGVGLITWGLWDVLAGSQFGIVMAVFGGIAMAVGVGDVRRFRGPDHNPRWLSDHLTRMIAAYIATVTAVSATNLTMFPPVVVWLWPTALGVPLILFWQAKYDDAGPLTRWVPA